MVPSTQAPHLANAPIGVFDSGIGGLSVLKHIHSRLPAEHLHYFADSRYAPYGNQTPEFIRQRAHAIADFLLVKGVKALVVACNTATAAAIDSLRVHYRVPVIGMEPAVKPAVAASKNGIIGVLATTGTLQSAQFAALLENYGQHVKIITQACPGLVELIERGELGGSAMREMVTRYLTPLLDAGADTIVLGCTHYPFIQPLISEMIGSGRQIIETGAAVARQVEHRLQTAHLLNLQSHSGIVKIHSNNSAPDIAKVIQGLWEKSAEICLSEI